MASILPILRSLPFFATLTERELQSLSGLALMKEYHKREVIFNEGGERAFIYFLYEGFVKAFKTDANGHEQVMSFIKAGEMFPHIGFFDSAPYPGTAIALEKSRLFVIPMHDFEALLTQSPTIAIKVMRVMGKKLQDLQRALRDQSHHSSSYRVARALLQLVEGMEMEEGGSVNIHFPITHQDLADVAGVSREGVTRLIKQYKKRGIIITGRGWICIANVEGLAHEVQKEKGD
ncbi:Crp/Fnr family transcriptional regulator [Mechercharimyces sp. CAU 1602]|uniref:Crp/Fnr family transcriptional regulator n=1 Tax=Mechercharimyces sp. CAU 1602 TaxID=2973933 RepID=UPI002162DBC4|nr:Crp/Fnr family transcriptional regulator [Mechercharimyces sp. CAU 1602]MCS1351927.1 Crp/Fnr family transcriptional regulator [Mechercharimyces sp. CAU 1602]